MTDPDRIIRESKTRADGLERAGRALGGILALVALVLALVVFMEEHSAAACAYRNATAQHEFTQAIERLFLPRNATPAEHQKAAAHFHHALDRYDASSADYQHCVR